MSKPETITIDDTKYVRADSIKQAIPTGNIKIVILPRGWNMIGYLSKEGTACKLEKAAVIRRWGTTKGLGELAEKGPLTNTILDKCPLPVEFNELNVIATLCCSEDVWKTQL
jgi:hypothetical protein